MNNNPKEVFAHAFLSLMSEKKIQKITIIDIVNSSKLSRQTFYRYFRGIDDLIYYIHTKNVSISYDFMLKDKYITLSESLYLDLMMENKFFYNQIITFEGFNYFTKTYIQKTKENLLDYPFKKFKNQILQDKNLSFSLEFYVYGSCISIFNWLKSSEPCSAEELANYITNSMPYNLKELYPKE